MSCLNNIERTIVEQKDLYEITQLYQYKGKDFFYNDIFKKEIRALINESINKECKAVMDIINLEVTPARVKSILKNDSEPKTGDETFLCNIKKVFKVYSESIDAFDLSTNQFDNLTNTLFRGIKKVKYKKYETVIKDNLLERKQENYARDDFNEIIVKFALLDKQKYYEVVTLIAAFYVDFIKLSPFTDFNDIIGLFVLYSMLYSKGFYMFRYISFFEIYNMHKDEFHDAYMKSQVNWEKGYANAGPLATVIRKMMIEGYQQVDALYRAKEIHKTNKKTDKIEYTIMKNLPDTFTREMVRDLNPEASPKTIDRTLSRLQDENRIRSIGKGRSAKWVKIENTEDFNIDDFKQLSISDLGINFGEDESD